jgi:hypothetical protein
LPLVASKADPCIVPEIGATGGSLQALNEHSSILFPNLYILSVKATEYDPRGLALFTLVVDTLRLSTGTGRVPFVRLFVQALSRIALLRPHSGFSFFCLVTLPLVLKIFNGARTRGIP